MKKTLTLILILISLIGFSQNNEVKKEQEDHNKVQKEIDKMLKREQSDSMEINIQEIKQAVPVSDEEPVAEPAIKEGAPLPPLSPEPSKSNLNLKSEPVPGAEIIIDKIPSSSKKKNKTKSSLNQNLQNNNEKIKESNK